MGLEKAEKTATERTGGPNIGDSFWEIYGSTVLIIEFSKSRRGCSSAPPQLSSLSLPAAAAAGRTPSQFYCLPAIAPASLFMIFADQFK